MNGGLEMTENYYFGLVLFLFFFSLSQMLCFCWTDGGAARQGGTCKGRDGGTHVMESEQKKP